MSRPRFIALLLALLTLLIYLPVVGDGFVNFDDNDYVTDNPPVKNGLSWAGIRWAFTTLHANNWHPLTWISHMIDCSLFGLDPAAHHLVNVLFHCANSILLFILLLRLTQKLWPCALIAALFAWHPLHVESVAWIAERKDVLSTFFALLTLWSYARSVQEKSRRHFWLALLFFALGLLAKPMVVTLPFVLLLLDFWPLSRSCNRQVFIEKIPFFALSFFSCLATFYAQSQVVHGDSAVSSLAVVPLEYRLKNVSVAYVVYLFKLFWPARLAVFYPLAEKISIAKVAGALAILISLSVLAWRQRRAFPFLIVGWLWFLGTLVPVIGLVQVGGAAYADRYSYFPSIGLFLAVTFLATHFVSRHPILTRPCATLAALILIACLGKTHSQLHSWQNSQALFQNALKVTADNDVARNDLANALLEKGDLNGALTNYLAAAKIAPDLELLHNNIAVIYDKLDRHADALAEYREASRCRPDDAVPHTLAGDQLIALGKFSEATNEFAIAEKLDPNYPWPHASLAQIDFKLGRDDDAIAELKTALRLAPDDYHILASTAHFLAANKNESARDAKNALVLALKANELSGHSQPVVFDILGMAFAANGDFTNAVTCAQNAFDLATMAKLKNIGQIEQRLELYKNNQPWLEDFRATNAPQP